MDGRDELPGYLADVPQTGHIYGRLSYNRRSKCWTIKGEPCVTEMAKRLFPGSARRRGEARFTANRRIIGEVNWLMLRYPLEIAERDRALWARSLEEAREHARRRELAQRLPVRSTPPPGTFCGELREFQKEGLSFLQTREGDFPIRIPNRFFLTNMHAAQIVCRQLGVRDSLFYEALSAYSLSLPL